MSGFWARRKAGIAAESQADAHAVAAAREAARAAEVADKTDAELLEELDLPDPDTLESGDDFSAFLREAVPARLRTRALRRLWRVNPVLANLDGLVDYGEDYTDAATVVKDLKTDYVVGKGLRKHIEEMARQAELKASGAQAVAAAPEEGAAEAEDLAMALGTEQEVASAELGSGEHALSETGAASAQDEVTDMPVPAARRRMQFTFQGEGVT